MLFTKTHINTHHFLSIGPHNTIQFKFKIIHIFSIFNMCWYCHVGYTMSLRLICWDGLIRLSISKVIIITGVYVYCVWLVVWMCLCVCVIVCLAHHWDCVGLFDNVTKTLLWRICSKISLLTWMYSVESLSICIYLCYCKAKYPTFYHNHIILIKHWIYVPALVGDCILQA